MRTSTTYKEEWENKIVKSKNKCVKKRLQNISYYEQKFTNTNILNYQKKKKVDERFKSKTQIDKVYILNDVVSLPIESIVSLIQESKLINWNLAIISLTVKKS